MENWLTPLSDAEGMRAIDRWAIEDCGVPSLELMERAGTELARIAAASYPSCRFVVICGKGNNGGDGLVAARHLHQWGHDLAVFVTGDVSEMSSDAQVNLEQLPVEITPLDELVFGPKDCVIDALLGTGFTGVPRGLVADLIEKINGSTAAVVSADVPSGVDASTGEVQNAIRANITVTFQFGKNGLHIWPGKEHAGEVRVVQIGIPSGAPEKSPVGLINSSVLDEIPRRGARATKSTAGRVGVIGGSTGLTGAPCLASMAAQRAGAGYVTAGVPGSLNTVFEQKLLEVMTRPLSDHQGAISTAALEDALDIAASVDALLVGPGLGRGSDTLDFVRQLAKGLPANSPAVVLDADGLNAFAGQIDQLKAHSNNGVPLVLTPHEGELGRLLEESSQEVSARRLENATLASQGAGAVLVLKGDDTIVAAPDGRVGISPGSCPELATAGTGDVLAGIITAYLAKGMPAFEATCAGVMRHLLAARHVAEQLKVDSLIASDVIAALKR